NSSFTIPGTITNPVKGKTVTINGILWTYYEHKITGQSTVTISGSGYIDELRLYPANARMISYTHEPLIGMTGKCDERNTICYYEYDGLGRLQLIRDESKNVIRKICYNYAGDPGNCNVY